MLMGVEKLVALLVFGQQAGELAMLVRFFTIFAFHFRIFGSGTMA